MQIEPITIKITNNGPEVVAITLRKAGAVHEVFYPQTILNPNDIGYFVIDDSTSTFLISQVTVQDGTIDTLNQGISSSIPILGGGVTETPVPPTPILVDNTNPLESNDTYTWDGPILTITKNVIG